MVILWRFVDHLDVGKRLKPDIIPPLPITFLWAISVEDTMRKMGFFFLFFLFTKYSNDRGTRTKGRFHAA